MKINKLFNDNKDFVTDTILDERENSFVLRELYLCALKGDVKNFDLILSQPVDVLSPFGFEMTISAGIEDREVSVDQNYEDYHSFLSFLLEKRLDHEFIEKVINKPKQEDWAGYFKHLGMEKSINLIAQCIQTGKPEALQLLLDKGVVTESGIYQTILFYSRNVLEPFIDKELMDNPALFHQTFKELKTHRYPCALGLEENHKAINSNITIFDKINYRSMLEILSKSMDKVNFYDYAHKTVLVEDIMRVCVNDMAKGSIEFQQRFADLKSFEFVKNATNTVTSFSRDQEVARLVLNMCKSGLLDIDGDVTVPLLSGEKGQRNISEWIEKHSSLANYAKEVKTAILERKLSNQTPEREDQKRVKI